MPTEEEMDADYAAGHLLVCRTNMLGHRYLQCYLCGYIPSSKAEEHLAKRYACLPDRYATEPDVYNRTTRALEEELEQAGREEG